MRRSSWAVFFVLLVLTVGPKSSWTQQRLVRVYVEGGSGSFTALGAGDSAADLMKSLQGKQKTLVVVSAASEADVVVRVKSRDEKKQLGSITSYEKKSDDGKKSTTTTVPTEKTIRTVYAQLQAGDFQTDLQAEDDMSWRGAAYALAGKIDKWVKENYAGLMEARAQQRVAPAVAAGTVEGASADPPAATESKSTTPAKEATIKPGMSPSEVAEAMGEPLKKVSFGAKTVWSYKEVQVVFENDKVTDVKF